MTEKVPNLKKETDIQVQEVQRIPNKRNSKRSIPRHIIMKKAKLKRQRIIKARREKQLYTKGSS